MLPTELFSALISFQSFVYDSEPCILTACTDETKGGGEIKLWRPLRSQTAEELIGRIPVPTASHSLYKAGRVIMLLFLASQIPLLYKYSIIWVHENIDTWSMWINGSLITTTYST